MNALKCALDRYGAVVGLVLLIALITQPLRHALEAQMSMHMLVQFLALILTGMLLAGALSTKARAQLAQWNAHGIAGLTFAALVLALAMIPRLLDLALVDAHVEFVKFIALLLCGAALRVSWRNAGVIVQGFFLGNVLPMMAIAGSLYETAPARVCNAYRLDEQQWVGQCLTIVAGCIAVVWLARVFWNMTDKQRPAAAVTPAPFHPPINREAVEAPRSEAIHAAATKEARVAS